MQIDLSPEEMVLIKEALDQHRNGYISRVKLARIDALLEKLT